MTVAPQLSLLDLRAWLRKDSGYAAWKHQPGSRKCNDPRVAQWHQGLNGQCAIVVLSMTTETN